MNGNGRTSDGRRKDVGWTSHEIQMDIGQKSDKCQTEFEQMLNENRMEVKRTSDESQIKVGWKLDERRMEVGRTSSETTKWKNNKTVEWNELWRNNRQRSGLRHGRRHHDKCVIENHLGALQRWRATTRWTLRYTSAKSFVSDGV
jgi:hypothetical protein